MPRVKKTTKQEDVKALIKGYLNTYEEISKAMGISIATVKRRMDNPGDITLNELYSLCHKGHIKAESIREAIQF